eukprot:COSAG02_NODE_1318_length_13293_cov_39.414886_8_plen_138_part_00
MLSSGISGSFGGSDDEDDCNAIAFGGSQLAQRQLQTRASQPRAAVLATGGIHYRATDPRHAPALNAANSTHSSSRALEVHDTRERKHEKQKKEKRKKEKRKKEKKERKQRKRDRKKEKQEHSRKKRRREDADASSSS